MKTVLLAAVVALAPAAQTAKPQSCQIVIHYMSDEPGKVRLDLPKSEGCGYAVKEQTAIEAALQMAKGYQK